MCQPGRPQPHLDARAGLQVVDRLPRKAPVGLEAPHGVIDVAVGGVIGDALLFEFLDEIEHLRDELRRARLVGGREAPEGEHVLLHRAGEFVGERVGRDAALGRAADDLVVHVGDVAHERDLVARRLEPAADHVEGDEGAAVADVAVVVDGDAADVHAHAAGFKGFEGALIARKGRVDRKHRSPAKFFLSELALQAGVAAHAQIAAGAVFRPPTHQTDRRLNRLSIQSPKLSEHVEPLQ